MNNSKIDALLEKYWAGESSLEEEAQLRQFFQSDVLDSNYDALRPMFVGMQNTKVPEISADAEDKWLQTFDQLEAPAEQGAKVIAMPKRNWWKVAAVALMLITAGTIWSHMIKQSEKREALMAYNETKKALAMIGVHFENGKETTALNINKAARNLEIIHTK